MIGNERRPGDGHPGPSKSSRHQAADHHEGSAPETAGTQLDLLVQPPDAPRPDHAGRDQAEAAGDEWWFLLALAAVRQLAASGRRFQCHDVVTQLGVPEPDSSFRWGALMARAHREGIVEMVGAEPSRRPTTHGALTRVWVGKRMAA